MTSRRSRGDGGLHWHEGRQRWIATASLGFDAAGRRVVKRGSGRTKTEAKRKLKSVLRDHEDGLAIALSDYTVAHAVNDWLAFGLAGRDVATLKAVHPLCRTHVLPSLGARRIRDLSADDVDKWLARKAGSCSTRTLQGLHSCLNRAIKRAMARDKVKRNVVSLCGVPRGRPGRPSKALTFAQAEAVLAALRNQKRRAGAKLVSSSPEPPARANRPDHGGGLMAHPTVSVTAVELLGGHRVRLRFDDEATVVRDLFPFLWGPVFDKIRNDPQEFATVSVDPELGVLCWSNGADIDAELLRYDDLWNEALPVSRPV